MLFFVLWIKKTSTTKRNKMQKKKQRIKIVDVAKMKWRVLHIP